MAASVRYWRLITLGSIGINLITIMLYHSTFHIDDYGFRLRYYEDVQRAYFNGCEYGTDYEDEWRTNKYEFNMRSPLMYCNAFVKHHKEETIRMANCLPNTVCEEGE